MNPIIATVYLPGGVSKAVRTFPGHVLPFVGGKAEVKHEWDMPHVLAMPDALVQVSKDWREWLPKWTDQIPGYDNKVKARVEVLGAETVDEEAPIGRHKAGCQCGMCNRIRSRRKPVAA